MKVVVLNGTGNVGKSFIAREVIFANLSEPKLLIDFESYNLPNSVFKSLNVESHTAETFKEMLRKADFADNVVVDVGSSNIIQFLDQLNLYQSVVRTYDLFVVPTVYDSKQMDDTKRVLAVLKAFNLQSQTRIVFNRVQSQISSATLRDSVISKDATDMGFAIDPGLRIGERSTVGDLTAARMLLDDVLSDKNDYRAMAVKEKDTQQGVAYYNRYLLRAGAASLKDECQAVWSCLVGNATKKEKQK